MKKVYVPIYNKAVEDVVTENELKKGMTWNGGKPQIGGYPYWLNIRNTKQQGLSYASDHEFAIKNGGIYTLDEYFTLEDKTLIVIGGYEVSDFDEKGFTVGCTKVTWKQVEEILKNRPQLRQESIQHE